MAFQIEALDLVKTNKTEECSKNAIPAGVSIDPALYTSIPRSGDNLRSFSINSQTDINHLLEHKSKSLISCKTESFASCVESKRKINETKINDIDSQSEGKDELNILDKLADDMLAITIRCVMLIAADSNEIPEEYLIFAERYLCCIKDDQDTHPPNVQGILNCIRFLLNKKQF